MLTPAAAFGSQTKVVHSSSAAPNVDFQAWLIDVDGTLYRSLPLRILMATELAVSGWTAVRILRRFRIEHEHLRREEMAATESPFHLQIQRTARSLGVEDSRVERVVERWMQGRPLKWLPWCRRANLLESIAAFRAAGGRVAAVSDYPATAKLRAMQITELFDVVVASGDVNSPKRLKPWPDGYLLAAEELGISPEMCLVIGDRDATDGEAARRAGMSFRLV